MIRRNYSGFTIVELLIVIVIIGILAAITVVAYNGIQDRARISSVSSGLSQGAKKLKLFQVDNPDTYPAAAGTNGLDNLAALGITNTSDVTYQYSSSTNTYCLTATNSTTSYKISNSLANPTVGGCAGHGQGGVAAITNFITNPNFETNTIGWAVNGTNSIVSSPDVKFSGAKSLKIVTTGTSNVGTNIQLPLDSGVTYTFSGYVYLPASFGSGLRMCVWGAPINGNALTCTSSISSTGSWQRLTYTATTTSAGTVRLYFYNGSNDAAIGAAAYVDGVMLTKSNSAYNFADGSTTNWAWDGTPDNSTSTGPPQ